METLVGVEKPRMDKFDCPVCKFNVKQEDHHLRCRPNGHTTSKKNFNKAAWIGDCLHDLDLRMILGSEDLEPAERHRLHNWYRSGPHQAEYMRQTGKSGPGDSEDKLSTLFEGGYQGAFRAEYLLAEFKLTPDDLGTSKKLELLGY